MRAFRKNLRIGFCFLVVSFLLTRDLTGCGGESNMESDAMVTDGESDGPDGSEYNEDDGGQSVSKLPLLDPGLHLGSTFYGGGAPPEGALRSTLEEGADSGMNAFSFYIDWFDMETHEGEIDTSALQAALAWQRELGLIPLLNLTIIDITELNFPEDLKKADGVHLAEGVAFDSQIVEDRLFKVLDSVVPLLADNGGFLLVLGNEVDEYFSEYPDADLEAYARLIGRARDYVHSLVEGMAVGVTLTGKGLLEKTVFNALRPVTDVIPFNYYPLITTWGDNWLKVKGLEEISGDIAELIDMQSGEPIVIQEMGCPSGEGSGSSQEHQASCFEHLFEALGEHENVRFVSVFTLFDFDETTCDLVVEAFGITEEDLPAGLYENWRSYLCTLGMLNPDYSPKPSWGVFLDSSE